MIKNKIFFDIEKENKWLNQLASEGFRLVEKSGFSYKFEESKDNSYKYYVEKRRLFKFKENHNYTEFLNDLDIQLVTKQWGWYYFEKVNDGKAFEIYTDVESRIKYYKRMFPVFILIAIINISIINSHLSEPTGPWLLGISVSFVANILILLVVILTSIKYILKIIGLNKQLYNE